MPELDYRDVRAYDVSVADLMDFDALMVRLTDRERTAVLRKIAHEVAESEPAQRIATVEESAGEMERQMDNALSKLFDAEQEIEHLKDKIEGLAEDLAGAERDAAAAEENLLELRREYTEAVARHAKELEEAEVRGYRRGREEAQAA